jgi:hypothetical protein
LQTLHKKQPGGETSKTQYWKAKGPDAMEVDASTRENTEIPVWLEAAPNMNQKKLIDEEKAALQLLGLCVMLQWAYYLLL